MKFYALQQASDLRQKNEAKWLEALGGEKMPFERLKEYLKSFIMTMKIVDKKLMQKNSKEEFQNILFTTDISFKNCELLRRHFSPVYAGDDKKHAELSSLCKACEKSHNDVKEKIENRMAELFETIPSQKM